MEINIAYKKLRVLRAVSEVTGEPVIIKASRGSYYTDSPLAKGAV